MDLKHGDDIYDSFRAYQNKLLREYSSMADEFHFSDIDARRSIDQIQDELRQKVQAFLEPPQWLQTSNGSEGSEGSQDPGGPKSEMSQRSDCCGTCRTSQASRTRRTFGPSDLVQTTTSYPSALRAYASCPMW